MLLKNKKSNVYIRMENISKAFPGVQALSNIKLDIEKGKVHAVIGENGAGKSTLMNILAGVFTPDSGTITIQGKQVKIKSPIDSQSLGIAMIHQELSVIDKMTIAENIFLGREMLIKRTPFINHKKQIKLTKKLLEEFGISIDPRTKVSKLSVADKQLVEIIKATAKGVGCVIMDEPTSALSESETTKLFQIIRNLTLKGVAIVYISHKLEEVLEVSNTITVMRDGCWIGKYNISEVNKKDLISKMIGRDYNKLFPKLKAEISSTKLRVKNLSKEGSFENISFVVRKGEILGIAGLMGAGRTELAEAIIGFNTGVKGEIFIDDNKRIINNPSDSIREKIAFVPEDRKKKGLNLKSSVGNNISIINLAKYCIAKQFILNKLEKREIKKQIKSMQIKTASIKQIVNNLSGGNQQKTVLAKCLITEPEILILDEPTRGIDVGAKAEIHRKISEIAQRGTAIILISSEMPEILGMCDRIITMHEGNLTGEFSRENFDKEEIFSSMMLSS